MNTRILKRNVQFHRAIADGLLAQFFRLWERNLCLEETDAIESCTLCLSFMRLEVLLSQLSIATDPEEADQVFIYIKSAVELYAPEVVESLANIPGVPREFLETGASGNLLTLEEVIYRAIAL
jgi:hypothetical protein